MATFASPGLIGGPRTTTVSTMNYQTADQKRLTDLTRQLEMTKIQQALAAAQSGQPTGDSPGALQAARLKAAMDQQSAGANSQQTLQTQRLAAALQQQREAAVNQRDRQNDSFSSQRTLQAERLAAALNQQNSSYSSQRTLQADRLNQADRALVANIQGKRDLQTDASNLEEKRRKDSAARALALFRAAPGGLGTLNTKAAAAELA